MAQKAAAALVAGLGDDQATQVAELEEALDRIKRLRAAAGRRCGHGRLHSDADQGREVGPVRLRLDRAGHGPGRAKVALKVRKKGKHKIVGRYLGSAAVSPATSKMVKLKVK